MGTSAAWSGKFEELRDYHHIPATTLGDILRYIIDGRKPGEFVEACICDSLQKAYKHGDLSNLKALWAITTWLYNRAPQDCLGAENYRKWKGLRALFVGNVQEVQAIVDEWTKQVLDGTVMG
jgi:hypothetical protein